MRTLFRPFVGEFGPDDIATQHQDRGQRVPNLVRSQLELLESRKLLSVASELPRMLATVGHPIEVRQLGQNANGHQPNVNPLLNLVTIEAKKKPVSFTLAQAKSALPGTW